MGKLVEMPRSESGAHDRLNPEQRAAVESGEGPLLVVAGAGTGKTLVITERIRHLLETNPELSGENILGLTFTDKAADEMKSRVVRMLGDRGQSVWLSTFHRFCHSVLLELKPEMEVLEETDHWILLRRHLAELQLEHYKRLAEPGRFLSDFVKFFSRCQDELVTPDDYAEFAASLRRAFEREKGGLDPVAREERELEAMQQEEIARAYRASESLLRKRKLYTFGALLMETVQELRRNRELLRHLRQRYRTILVDEFQDTNIAQIELLWLLAGPEASGRNIIAVGDDDQAIYRFRGASFGSFQLFAEKFMGKKFAPDHPDAPVVKLVRNYRSTKRILRVAGQTIQQNADRVIRDKQLIAENDEGEKIRLVEFASPEEEAHWVAEEIAQLHEKGRAWRDFAVLYRAHAHRNHLVVRLAEREIPFVIRNLSILDSTLVRDVTAYLRLIDTPSDDVACARALAAPAWGLEPMDLVRLTERTSRSRHRSLWDMLNEAQGELNFAQKAKRTADLILWVQALREKRMGLPVSELVDLLLPELLAGLDLVGLPPKGERKALERFRKFVDEWEKKSETRRLREFVEYLDYFREAGGQMSLEEEDTEDAVQLMTAHGAKGLEFDHVFILRLTRGAFPTWPRPRVLEFPEALMKEALPEGDFHVQEERRLFYVALTRARRRLTLTAVINKRSKPSAFLDDVLMNPEIQKRDLVRLTPNVKLPPLEPAAEAARKHLFAFRQLESRAYSRVAHWAASYHPPVFEPLQLSASAMETYLRCPQKYLLQHVWGVRGGPQAALTFGNVMHTTIREFILSLRKKRKVPFADLKAIYERQWLAAGFQDAYQEEEYRRAGLEQLEEFHRRYLESPADVLHQEKTFELPLDNNLVVTGRMDQINRVGPNEVEIVDYKTGKPREAKDARHSLQLSLYALAAREVLELNPVRLTFYNLTTNEPVTVSRDEKQLKEALSKVQEVAGQIRAGEFPAAPGFYCRTCEYQPLCPAYEQLVTIRS
jgi:DNA helicase-2/ATP-dependent DNA helicase PcrA